MKTYALMLIMLMAAGGCVTTQQRRLDTARRERELEALKADVYRVKEQTGSASAGYEQVYADIERLRREQTEGDSERDARLDAIEAQLRKQDAALQAMHKQIVAELSQKIATIMKSQSRSQGVEYGREHVIKKGETLSEIAAAYHVTVKGIVQANALKDANAVRVGQKLFIPE